MRRNNLFAKFIITFTLAAFLTMSVGKVQRTYAMATTAAIAGAALLGTGAIYLGYLALTGGSVSIPSGTGQDIQDYLTDVGRKVAYYGSGAFIYQKLYSYLRSDGVGALNTYDVTFTQDDLKSLYNDFKDISLNQSVASYSLNYAVPLPSAPFDYAFELSAYPSTRVNYNNTNYTLDYIYENYTVVDPIGTRFVFDTFLSVVDGVVYGYPFRTSLDYEFRNVLQSDGYYRLQYLNNGVWTNFTGKLSIASLVYQYESFIGYMYPYGVGALARYDLRSSDNSPTVVGTYMYPIAIDSAIYDETTGETIEVIPREDTEVVTSPDYEDNDNYPVVPYVQLPDGGNWGFNLGDLLTDIINRAGQIVTASWIGSLINQFMNSLGGDTGDYIYYSDNDNNYYIYYSNVYQGDDYTTYNINVGDQQQVVPVDLNTIQEYTDNEYLDVVKERVNAFSDTVGSFVAFWHNTDYEIVYAVFGSALIVLLGAFIGKWGHS